jgi:hypothetical protein
MKNNYTLKRTNILLFCVAVLLVMLPSAFVADTNAQKAAAKDYFAHIKPEHAAAVKNHIGKATNLIPAQLSDYKNDYGLGSLRAADGKNAHPFYAVRDFNRDKIADFAVVLKDTRGKADENFTLLVFNGLKTGGYKFALRVDKMALETSAIGSSETMGGAQTALAVGEYETDNCLYFKWNGKTYVANDCSEGEN